MNVTVSIADFLLVNEVSNCITTYWPAGAPGNSAVAFADFNLRDTKSPSGLRTISIDVFHFSSVTAFWKKADAFCQLCAHSPWSIAASHDWAAEVAAFS